jgi:alkyldihydroxyacetonephosphate synthase
MSNMKYKGFRPDWLLTPAPEDSYRSIFRWGDPHFFKYPKESLYLMMKEVFHLTDDDFKSYSDDIGFDKVELSGHPRRSPANTSTP